MYFNAYIFVILDILDAGWSTSTTTTILLLIAKDLGTSLTTVCQ